MPKNKPRPKPLVMIILEGFGVAPANPGNAITEAAPPYLAELISRFPSITLAAAGEPVGLGNGAPGSSEHGYQVIGRGAPKYDTLAATSLALAAKPLGLRPTMKALKLALKKTGRLHLIGLVSTSDSEASLDHLKQIIDEGAPEAESIHIHAILGGREAIATGGRQAVAELNDYLKNKPSVRIVSLCGRLYGLDRLGHIERTEKAFQLMRNGVGNKALSAEVALAENYDKHIFDEEFPPTIIGETGELGIGAGDAVLFFNHAPVSRRQLADRCEAEFGREAVFYLVGSDPKRSLVSKEIAAPRATLGRIIAEAGLRQLRLADSESFAAVTHFFDSDHPLKRENVERKLVPISRDGDYLINPKAVARECIAAIEGGTYDVIITGFAGADRAAHTGDMEVAQAAVQALDESLKIMIRPLLESGGVAVITASHGAAERTVDFTGAGSRHTVNPVPFLLVGQAFEGYSLGLPEAAGGDLSILKPAGSLIDVAPTVLAILGLEAPSAMTGKSFIS